MIHHLSLYQKIYFISWSCSSCHYEPCFSAWVRVALPTYLVYFRFPITAFVFKISNLRHRSKLSSQATVTWRL